MTETSRTLNDWLAHAERTHVWGIELGLERVGQVARQLGFEPPDYRPAPRNVIVAGTNGKGSTCVALEALLMAHGRRVGTTLSPHVHVFNERVRLDGEPADDATLCAAFAAVDAARGAVPLTYFEFSALVALYCFRRAAVDVAVLEVGLGGRLDAFNLTSADVAVITSIGLDHQDWLGDDLETIGREKAGVMRPAQRVVAGADVTASVVDRAAELGCAFSRLGRDFDVTDHGGHWDYRGSWGALTGLPAGGLAPHNAALALEAAAHLVALDADRAAEALAGVNMPGRFEIRRLPGGRLLVLDVAHNPAGAAFLARRLESVFPGRRFVALFGMLADKDTAGVVNALADRVGAWICLPTRGHRGLAAEELAGRVAAAAGGQPVFTGHDAGHGLDQALSGCSGDDGILVFGSFSLVEQVRDRLDSMAAMDMGV